MKNERSQEDAKVWAEVQRAQRLYENYLSINAATHVTGPLTTTDDHFKISSSAASLTFAIAS